MSMAWSSVSSKCFRIKLLFCYSKLRHQACVVLDDEEHLLTREMLPGELTIAELDRARRRARQSTLGRTAGRRMAGRV